jgi:hypothetical protein
MGGKGSGGFRPGAGRPRKVVKFRRPMRHLDKYGMTVASYQAMALQQGHRCAICLKERKLVVDHCHATGEVRALLCNQCNVGLGAFADDVEAIERAATYLRNRETGETLYVVGCA